MMQRSIGKHHAERVIAGRKCLRNCGVRPPFQDDDRTANAGECRAFGIGYEAKFLGSSNVGDHQRKRLVAALLALAQQLDRDVIEWIADQMESTQAFNRYDATFVQKLPRRL